MKDVCFIHYKEYPLGGYCPTCLALKQERSLVVLEKVAPGRQPGDKIWNIVKWLFIGIGMFLTMTILGAMLMSGK